ncbi:hypothetical protein Cal6303_1425 [Calothrix sp. PCC 6303]|nr:hypothetical protein Cal6303_1425 [Calothrix sp. PCC 6303]
MEERIILISFPNPVNVPNSATVIVNSSVGSPAVTLPRTAHTQISKS